MSLVDFGLLASRGVNKSIARRSSVSEAPAAPAARPSTKQEPALYLPAGGSGIRYLFDPLAFATEILKWTPDARQREALDARRARKILNWARQCGKTETAAVEAIHVACTCPGSLVVVIGGVQDHIDVFFDRIDAFLDQSLGEKGEDIDNPINMANTWLGGPVTRSGGKRIIRRFPNRSRIVGLTTNKAVRSHTARFIILDEAGYIDNEVWEGVLPTLATTDGNILVIGTPRGAKGWYFDLWNNKKNTVGPRGWFKSQYLATENPRISPDYLAEMRMTRGDTWMRQEFGCEFLHDGRTLLHPDDVDALFDYHE